CCVASSARSMSRRILCATAWSRSPTATARLAKACSSPRCARITSWVSMPLPSSAPGAPNALDSYGREAPCEGTNFVSGLLLRRALGARQPICERAEDAAAGRGEEKGQRRAQLLVPIDLRE